MNLVLNSLLLNECNTANYHSNISYHLLVLQLNPVKPLTQPPKQVPVVRSQVLFLQYLLHCAVQLKP